VGLSAPGGHVNPLALGPVIRWPRVPGCESNRRGPYPMPTYPAPPPPAAMYHVRTAPSVTIPSLPSARAHGTSSRSAYATLGYRWLLSTNIWRLTYSPSHF